MFILKININKYRTIYRLYYWFRHLIIHWYVLLPYYRYCAKKEKKEIIHFLHIGKNGGTSVKHAFQYNRSNRPYITSTHFVFLHKHEFTLKQVRNGEKVFFFLRDPIDRFVSGFRYRASQIDLIDNIKPAQFSPKERQAIHFFKTPNTLAEALTDPDCNIRKKAFSAMNSIEHVKTSFWDWLISEDYLNKNREKIFFFGWQYALDDGILYVKNAVHVADNEFFPKSSTTKRKTSSSVNKDLTKKAKNNLKRWYNKDYECLDQLSRMFPNFYNK